MNFVNGLLNPVFSLMFAPFAALPAWVALVFWSVVFGVLMAVAFKYTSPQVRLKRVVDRIRANMLGMKLFKDDLGVTLRIQGRLFAAIGLRLLYSIPPMLVMIVPFVLILTQFARWYEHRPLRPGEPTIVELRLTPASWDRYRDVQVEAPPGVHVAKRVRDGHNHVINWEIRADSVAEPFELTWRLGDLTVRKRVAVAAAQRLIPVSPLRPGPEFEDRLLYPGESAFAADAPLRGIEVRHPPRKTPIFGGNIPWWGTFLIVSMLAAFASKPFTRVQF
jgi:hypothetical protein